MNIFSQGFAKLVGVVHYNDENIFVPIYSYLPPEDMKKALRRQLLERAKL